MTGVAGQGRAPPRHEIGEGRLLPSLSIEQFAAPLARWMGLAPQHLGEVLPNAHRFDTSALDLLRA